MSEKEPGEWDPMEDGAPLEREEELREEEYPNDRWNEEGEEPGVDDCPSCGVEMLSDGARCPKCGEYVVAGSASRTPRWILVTAALLAIVFIWGLVGC